MYKRQRLGLHVVKSNPKQGHDIHSVIDGFKAWSVVEGANLQYTSHYVLKDFDIIGKEDGANPTTGIGFGKNTFDIIIVDSTVSGFKNGLNLKKGWSKNIGETDPSAHDYVVVNTTLDNNKFDYAGLDTSLDTILDSVDPIDNPYLTFKDPVSYTHLTLPTTPYV